MGRRAVGLLLALVLLGGALGWAWADLTSAPVTSGDAAEPIAADDPSLPYAPSVQVEPDSDLPLLEPGIPTHDETVGTGEPVVVPVPDGWERVDTVPAREARWTAPGDPPGAYLVTVRVIQEEATLTQRVEKRATSLFEDEDLSSVEVLETSGDTLVATFVNAGYRRLVVVRWVSFGSGTADVEIAAAGRVDDRAGLENLVARMGSGVRAEGIAP